jgi:hypothetical protein
MEDIDKLLETYEDGKPENKPDVLKQLKEIREKRELAIKEHMKKQEEYNFLINKTDATTSQKTINEQSFIIHKLTIENEELKSKLTYFENKIKKLIAERIEEKMKQKN